MKLGESAHMQVETIPSGSLALDIALGIGGFPRGRIIEVYGPESSGKTTVALHAIAEVQKVGGTAAFIDAEHALDRCMPASLASTLMNCCCPSRTQANKRSRSRKRSCAAERSTSLLLTL